MKVQLHLVGQRFLTRTRKSVGGAKLIDDGEWSENSVFLVDSDTTYQLTPERISRNSQLFALVKVHRGVPKLIRRQHIEDKTDIRIGPSHQLIDHCRWNLHLLLVQN